MTCTSAPSVTVAQADQVIELGRRGLEHVGIGNRLDLVDDPGPDVHRLPSAKGALVELLDGADTEDQFATKDVHRLVLPVVILAAENLARLHVQDLADIAIGAGPYELMSPRLLDAIRNVWHSTLRGVEIERGWDADARADARTAGDATLATEHRMPRVIHDQRLLADRAGVGAGPARLATKGNAPLGHEFERAEAVALPPLVGNRERVGGTGPGARHVGTGNAGRPHHIQVRGARRKTRAGGRDENHPRGTGAHALAATSAGRQERDFRQGAGRPQPAVLDDALLGGLERLLEPVSDGVLEERSAV